MFRVLSLVLVLCAPVVAWAGAFMQAPEHGQVIAELGFSEAGREFDALGRSTPVSSWRKFELTAYGEYGLADWITLIGTPSWFTFRAPAPRPSNYFGPLGDQTLSRAGAAALGARIRVHEWGDNVLSVQAMARYSAGGGGAEAYADMGRRAQADVRLLYGRKIELMGMSGYVDTQVGFRSDGPFGNQVRIDGTFALRPFDRTTLMLQSFTAITPGRLGAGFALSQKVQASALFDMTDRIALQVGAVLALRGVNSAAERGLVSGVWYRF